MATKCDDDKVQAMREEMITYTSLTEFKKYWEELPPSWEKRELAAYKDVIKQRLSNK